MCIFEGRNMWYKTTLLSIGGNEYGIAGHPKIFTFLKHFMIIL